MKPWPISEDNVFHCLIGADEVRSRASWYDILIGHPDDDEWAILVEQYVVALLNIESGANDVDVADALNEARDIIEDCDGWVTSKFNRAMELLEVIIKFNAGETKSALCGEKPCCVFNDWEAWGACTKPCGGGIKYRYEQCFCPMFTGGIPDDSWCAGEQLVETKPCNEQSCDEPPAVEEGDEEEIGDDEDITILQNQETSESTDDRCTWGEWSECSQDCGGIKWRDQICVCPEETPDCGVTPEPRQKLNCDKSLPCPYIARETSCSWARVEDWSDCSAECDGIRTRKQSCYCENYSEIYDDSFCVGLPVTESEPCNTTQCIPEVKSLSFWKKNNRYATHDHNLPWPIPEDSKFECDRGPDPIRSQMTWYELVSLPDAQARDQWIKLAREFIVTQLNIENGDQIDSQLNEIISNSKWILRDCDGFSENDGKAADVLYGVLSDHNFGNNTVYDLEELSTLMGHSDKTNSKGSLSPIIIPLVGAMAVMALIGIIFVWRRSRAKDIVTYAPEFELPDPDEEMIPSSISSKTYVYGEEDQEVSYELGELDELEI